MRAEIQAVLLLARLGFRRTGRGLWLTSTLLGLPVLVAGLALAAGQADLDLYKQILSADLRYVIPFLMALQASGAVADEVQNKTITYLFSRPIPRWTLPLGKHLGSAALTSILAAISLTLVFLLCMLSEPSLITLELPVLGTGLVCILFAILLYGAVATAFGTAVTRYPFVASLLFLLLADVAVAAIPGRVKLLSMSIHLEVLAGLYRPLTTMFVDDPTISRALSLIVVAGLTAAWLSFAMIWVGRAEYRTDQ